VKAVKRVVRRAQRKSPAPLNIKLNCDLGEGFGAYTMGCDEEIMPLIDCANVACGYHGGDPSIIRKTVLLAKRHKVEIGAHVAYPDLQGFGRRSMSLRGQELIDCIQYQISALDGMARTYGSRVTYVKPHGALYNDMNADKSLESTVMKAIASWYRPLDLVMLATPGDKKSVETAFEYGLTLRFEAFADRGYTRAGYLVPRDKPGALLDVTAAVAQAKAITSGTLRSVKGHKLNIRPDTLCVHGDTPEALEMLKAIRSALQVPAG
jgi:UPF0271 protein